MSTPVTTLELQTPHGIARAHVHAAGSPRAMLVLGHGAGGGIAAADLVRAAGTAVAADVSTVLVEQPYRVAGRRSPAPARQLDTAWISVVQALRARHPSALPIIVGGRSSGARVACRTVAQTGAVGVVCLAFPLLAPARADGMRPSRLDELDAVQVPVLVIQGLSDPFGMPPAAENRAIVQVAGDHSLRKQHDVIAAELEAWLTVLLASPATHSGPTSHDLR